MVKEFLNWALFAGIVFLLGDLIISQSINVYNSYTNEPAPKCVNKPYTDGSGTVRYMLDC